MARRIAFARWRAHARALPAEAGLHGWLTDTASLTAKLTAASGEFRVRRLRQRIGRCTADEAAALGLRRALRVREREVLLVCDGVPVVYAHTVVPLTATTSDWPFFSTLGERSLGTTLFGDPRVSRGMMVFATLRDSHPLARRAAQEQAHGAGAMPPLPARRCLYRRKRGLLLVTEIFLPAILGVGGRAARKASAADKENV